MAAGYTLVPSDPYSTIPTMGWNGEGYPATQVTFFIPFNQGGDVSSAAGAILTGPNTPPTILCTVSSNIPNPAKNNGNSCNDLGNPCNAGTGNKHQREIDYIGEGAYPIRAERIYNSQLEDTLSGYPQIWSAWGNKWRGFYDRSISLRTNKIITTATVNRSDGKQYYYNLVNGIWVGDTDVTGKLVDLGVNAIGNFNGWNYISSDDEIEKYGSDGKLLSITNRAGLTQTLTYNSQGASPGVLGSVIDPYGRTLSFTYDGFLHLHSMTDPAGGIYIYIYSGTDFTANLTSVTYPDGRIRTYLYGETANVSATPNAGVSYAHALTGIIDENGTRYASWTYDAAGLATSSEHGTFGSGIDHVGMAYTTTDANGNSTTSVTDVKGVTRTYNFSTILGVVKNTAITGQPCNGCNAAVAYDGNGNVSSRTDFNGNTTCHAYDLTRNLETTRLEGLPSGTACPADLTTATLTGVERRITTQWHATYRLPTMIAEPLRITTNAYDTQGNLISKNVQPTSDVTGGAGFGGTAAGTPRTSSYTYTTAADNTLVNLLKTADGPRTDVADVTTYGYDIHGNLTTVTNALTQITTLGNYDANGRPGTFTDPNGLVTSLYYDARGRLTSRSAGGEITRYTYDGVGNLTNVTVPSGAANIYTYDAAHRLTQIADGLGNKLVYTLDAGGNRTKEQLYDSASTLVQTHSRVFDALSRLYQDIGAVNQATVYTYDANGNLKTVTDPLNRLTSNVYDALNRLNQVTNPDTGIVRYGYDGLDQLTRVTDPRNLLTQYTRDGLGNLNQTTSPDTGAASATYDAAENIRTRTDAKGQVASYTYDVLNRLTGISYSGGTAPAQTVAYQYDQGINGIGHLTKIIDVTGTNSYAYDQHGRLITGTELAYGAVYTTAYSYDSQGRLAGITYPSGRTVNYTLDTMGRINSIATSLNNVTQVLVNNIIYRPFGGVQSMLRGNGLIYARNFDQDGRIASYTLNSKLMSIGYDAASQIAFISDPVNPLNPANYNYDPMSRLSSYIQGSSNQSFNYDTEGNRISQTIGTASTVYTYPATSNRLSSIQIGAAAAQSVTQDANGSTTADSTRQYSYDIRGRLIQSTTAQGTISYEVNALGLRVRKQVPYASSDTEYHYDAQGHLISEGPTAGTQFTREFVYLGDIPVAVIQ